jgi:LMBR1 domain-containing protein 1
MDLLWTIFFWLIPIFIFVLLPFSTFYYESDDGLLMAGVTGDNPVKKSRLLQALCNLAVVDFVVGLVFMLTFLFLRETSVPVKSYTGGQVISDAIPAGVIYETVVQLNSSTGIPLPFQTNQLEDMNSNDLLLWDIATEGAGLDTLSLNLGPATFYAGLMAFIGWFFFALFGGIGLAAVPMDLIRSFTGRPKHMTPEEFQTATESIHKRVNDLVDIGEDIKKEREERSKIEATSGGFASFFSAETRKIASNDNKTLKEFKAAVFILEKDVEDFTAASSSMEKYNPLAPYFSLLMGIISGILSLFWVLHIVIYIIPSRPLRPFLNNYFVFFDAFFPLFGVLSVAAFSFYLLICAVKGCFKFGLRFLFFQVHPMKVGATYMSSFMFNIGLVLLCALPVVQFSATAFEDYARFSSIRQIFGVQIAYLKFFTYFWANNIFIYSFLAMSVLTFIYLMCKPKDQNIDAQALRDRLKSRGTV